MLQNLFLDRIETLVQAIEYFGTKKELSGTSWWESTEEVVEDPLLIDFLEVIQERFYHRKVNKKNRLASILDFIIKDI